MKTVLIFVVSILIGLGIGTLIGNAGIGDGLFDAYSKLYTRIMLFSLLPILLLVIGIHELGHVAAGQLNNFQFYGLTVGPFAWKPDENGKIRFAWNTRLNIAGGIAMMLPRGTDNLRNRFAWYIVGGPLASLALFLLGYLLSVSLPFGSLGELLLGTTGFFSLFIFIVTIIPMHVGGFSSDGRRIITFLGTSIQGAAEILLMQIIGATKVGKPVTDFHLEEIIRYTDHDQVNRQMQLSFRYYAYQHAVLRSSYEEADQHLQLILDNLDAFPEGMREAYYLEQAEFEAVYRNNLPAARLAMTKFKPFAFSEASSLHIVNAAIARLEKDWPRVLTEITAAEKTLDQSMDQSRVPEYKARLAAWRAEATANAVA